MSNFAEILRSTQKDETVRTQLTNDFSTNFLLKIFGPRKWLAHKKWIEASCHFLYLSVTTLSDFQTLGEEYTGIVQVVQDPNTKKLNLPSKFKRLIMILIQTFGPEVLKTFLIPKITKNYSPEKVILTEVLDLISKINLLWFYVQGTYYHIAKRFLGIQYAKLRPLSYEDPNLKWIKIISAVNALILFYQFVMKVRTKLSETRDKEDAKKLIEKGSLESGTTTSNKKCPLCLEPRIETASTICGHLFCWTCIHESVRNRSECPICREPLRPAQIIRLMNYS